MIGSGAKVRTVLGDVDASTLGVTYAHEHLIIEGPLIEDRWPEILLPSEEEAIAELAPCRRAGLGAVVDAMPAGAGRNILKLAEISRRTGIDVVAVTGLHTAKYYAGRGWIDESPEVLADLFSADVAEGVDAYDYSGPVLRRTGHRAGIVKVATAGPAPTDRERRLFAAAAEVHRRHGVPLLTHCEGGEGGLAHVELLVALGVAPERVILSHTDKNPDRGYHRSLLETGANVVYDQALRQAPSGDGTARLVADGLESGFVTQLLVGTDGARRSLWRTLGGAPGLDFLLTGWREVLAGCGVDEAAWDALLVTNPARVLSLA